MIVLEVGLSPHGVPCVVGEIFPWTHCKERARTMEAGVWSYFLTTSKYLLKFFGMSTIPLPLIEAKRLVENNDRRGVGSWGLPTVSTAFESAERSQYTFDQCGSFEIDLLQGWQLVKILGQASN